LIDLIVINDIFDIFAAHIQSHSH